MSRLETRNCKPCEGGVDPLSGRRAAHLVRQVAGWELDAFGRSIHREFSFRGFPATMSFINALAWIANRQGHHPDISAGYNYCKVTFTTHAIGGLSENDFICAARLNAMAGG